ncbi:HAD family hydrolase [Marinigracilibium pacificum]|uniref:phosphoserine phosphatase n=1 Tax=Marinigracilibium pacificum TaxID=2729599 RepID=A0A848J2Z2_9BACT|nr:HAD family hydrolase [Marinigracilibium pacificum]NMM47542.1 haloacid dehalogenase-like hydrolase [Marinigracilibium pacificum]
MRLKASLLILLILFSNCQNSNDEQPKKESEVITTDVIADPLPSWNEGNTKQSIIDFVEAITNETSKNFVKPADRIATFDNDGTLWSEKPFYFQVFFAIDRYKKLSNNHPEWQKDALFTKLNSDNPEVLSSITMHELMELVMKSHAGVTTVEFEKAVIDWINKSAHPKSGKHFNEMTFQPMIELVEYLQKNQFKVYIVSGGGVEFMRPWVEKAYSIPKEQIIGSTIKSEFSIVNGDPIIKKLPEIDFIDDKEGKPLAINRIIGKKPIFTAGNSDGDLQMAQWTASNNNHFILFVHHTDDEREWAYDRESSVGQFNNALDIAMDKGWTIVDMKNDWNKIHPFDD